MTTLAGQTVVAGRVPVERIGQTILSADSGTFTGTETEVMNLTVPLVNGRTYRISFYGHANSSVGTDEATFRIREDNSVGNELTQDRVAVAGSTTSGRKIQMIVEFTAVATANKTFSLTGNRSVGTGNCFIEAGTSRRAYLYCDYIRGI